VLGKKKKKPTDLWRGYTVIINTPGSGCK